MGQEILSVAIFESLPGKDEEVIATLRDLVAALAAGGYSRDVLYRDAHLHFVLTRYWKSEDARRAAQEDPEVQRCWAKIGNEIKNVTVYETLKEMTLF
jgi:quinol monooxygenase YgiN